MKRFVWLTSTHHQRRARIDRRRLVHAVLDGEFELAYGVNVVAYFQTCHINLPNS